MEKQYQKQKKNQNAKHAGTTKYALEHNMPLIISKILRQ